MLYLLTIWYGTCIIILLIWYNVMFIGINIETGPANLRLVEYAALKEKKFLSTIGSLKYNCLIFKWT